MKRGDVWITSRLGHDRKVIVVGIDIVTAAHAGVLVVPISDVKPPGLLEPTVCDSDGVALGIADVAFVGQVSKTSFTTHAGVLAAASAEVVDMSLRTVLAL